MKEETISEKEADDNRRAVYRKHQLSGVSTSSENNKDLMTATHENKEYVASFSLEKRLKLTEWVLAVNIVINILLLMAVLAIAVVKWDVVLRVLMG